MYTIHATKKLLDRVREGPLPPVEEPATALGNWYANLLFWKPQVVLLVNERTLLPVLMPAAPASSIRKRIPEWVGRNLEGHGITTAFVQREVSAMGEARFAKTASRSVLGVMNEFRFLAGAARARGSFDLLELSLWLSETPCGPLYAGPVTPDQALRAAVADLEQA